MPPVLPLLYGPLMARGLFCRVPLPGLLKEASYMPGWRGRTALSLSRCSCTYFKHINRFLYAMESLFNPQVQCEHMVDHAVNRDPTVKFLAQKMEEVPVLFLP